MINLYQIKLHQQLLEEQCSRTIISDSLSKGSKLMNHLKRQLGKGLVRMGDSIQKSAW